MSNASKPIYGCNACSCVCACVCVWIAALLCCHRETMCAAAAAKEGPPKPGLTRSDSSVYLSLALTADRWIALIHRRKNRRRESGGRARRGGMEREEEREGERERESPEDDSPALLSVQRAGVWLSATQNNKPSTTQCSAKLSLPPYLSLSPPFLSNPSPPLILSFYPQPFYCRPLLALCSCSFMLHLLFPRLVFNTLWSIFMFSSLPTLFALPFTRLLSASICHPGVFVSLYLRWERQG